MSRRRIVPTLISAALIAAAAGFVSCHEPAGPPSTLDAGQVAFDFFGQVDGRFEAEGQCYYARGYPAADPSCALALERGDTLRLRGSREPWTIRWGHLNVDFPRDGECGAVPCRIALDFLDRAGSIQAGYRSTEATVVVTERTADRVRGTFSGHLANPNGTRFDTIRIENGTFDVPITP